MGLKQQFDIDLKEALLSGQKDKAGTLRIIKSTILNEEIAQGVREQGLSDDLIIQCLKKEAKKRQEAADLYTKAGSNDRADQELNEKRIIESYLPTPLGEDQVVALVDAAIAEYEGDLNQSAMGPLIAAVRTASQGNADGALVARLVKEKIN